MKFPKIFAYVLAATSMVACSDGDYTPDAPVHNTDKDVTVSLEDADISFLETKGLVNVPVVVTGARNGYVTVTCTVKEYGDNVAMEDVHYLLTSQTINIDTADNVGNFEIKLVDDEEENQPRKFVVTLVSAEGATISGIENTVVTIKDNDSDPYLKMAGEWYISGYDANHAPAVRTVHIDVFEEGTPGYYNFFTITGILDEGQEGPTPIKANFNWDEASKEGSMSIDYGQDLPVYVHSSYGTGQGFLAWLTGSGGYSDRGSALYTWNEKARVMTLQSWPGDGQYPVPGADFTYLLEFDAGIMLYDEFYGLYEFTREKP